VDHPIVVAVLPHQEATRREVRRLLLQEVIHREVLLQVHVAIVHQVIVPVQVAVVVAIHPVVVVHHVQVQVVGRLAQVVVEDK